MTREEVVAVAERQELGQLIDELGVRQQIDPDETVCGAVVLVPVGVPIALPELEPAPLLLLAGARPAMVMLSSTRRLPA